MDASDVAKTGLAGARRVSIRAYAWAVGMVVLATMARAALDSILTKDALFITYFPVVAIAGMLGGGRAGVLATVLSALAAMWFIVPHGSFRVNPSADISLALFVAGGFLISAMAGMLGRSRRRETTALHEKDMLAAERKLEEQMRLQSAALEAAANGIAITDRNGNILWVNPAFEQLTGHTRAECIGKNPKILRSGKQGKEFFQRMWDTILTGKVWHGELVNQRKDGTLYDEEMTITPVCDPTGQISHFIAIKQDISQRKRAEEAHRYSERRLQRAFDIETVGVLFFREDGVITEGNKAFFQMTGYTPPDLEQDKLRWNTLAAPESVARSLEAIEEFKAKGRVTPFEKVLLRKDGTRCWVLFSCTRVGEEEGVAFIIDVNAQKEVEHRLSRNEQRYRLLFDRNPDGVFAMDETGRFKEANQACETISGYPVLELLGKTFMDLCAPDRLRDTVQNFREKLLHRTFTQMETAIIRKDGRRLEIWVAAQPVVVEGKLISVYCTVKDITQRKRFEAELERLVTDRTRELRETNEQLNAFCYSIAHDLKAPLRAQAAFAAILEQDYGPVLGQEGSRHARRIVEAAERQSRLVSDLLSHMSLGRTDLPLTPVDLATIVEQARTDLVLEVQQKQAEVQIGPLNGHVLANAASLHLVIVNLLSNALKFVAPGVRPQVRVWAEALSPAEGRGASKGNARIRLWVQDNGISIPPDQVSKIFGVFQRLHTTSGYPGTGIGLAIVKKAVERMGG
ncbi:MAG TPA: PAS domain S-box protein, partial [Clostridia bacterium]|nr:PAS domain S-box protein [Clostridia bacterium]